MHRRSLVTWVGVVTTGVLAAVLAVAPPASAQDSIDTQDRLAVTSAYQTQLAPALLIPTGWNGDLATCRAGETTAQSQQSVLDAVNYMRAMVGLGPVELSARLSERSQDAALIMAANDIITHDLPRSARCWTEDGYLGAKNGNLALGYGWAPGELATVTGARAVVSYMNDPGPENGPVGHRRWLLYQQLSKIGNGDTDISNSIYLIGTGRRAVTPTWVSWPTAGYFPRELEPNGRWSLTYPKADFSRAKVTVQTPQGEIPVQVHKIRNGYGDNSISWDMQLPDEYRADPVSDYSVTVKVTGIRHAGKKLSREWTTTLIKASS